MLLVSAGSVVCSTEIVIHACISISICNSTGIGGWYQYLNICIDTNMSI